jgi:cation-transporting ATPase E
VAVLLILSQLHSHETRQEAATSTVAALVGMVPQGLVLLTSIAFGAAAVTLARRRVLVQQLPAVEGLARVDVVCLDKTGTLTDGTITFDSLIRLDDQAPAEAALGALADDENRNATLAAIGQAFPPPQGWTRQDAVPFSSARKWSAASFAGTAPGCWERRKWCCPAARTGCCREPQTWPPADGGSSRWRARPTPWTARRSRRACARWPLSCSPSG